MSVREKLPPELMKLLDEAKTEVELASMYRFFMARAPLVSDRPLIGELFTRAFEARLLVMRAGRIIEDK